MKSALCILSKDESLYGMRIETLIFGSSYSKEIADVLPFPVHFLGNISDERALVMAYNCMDVFVVPSLAEAFGQTILESIACGTPVVGFNVGGIPDMVNVNTGYLAEYKNSEDLAKGISFLLKKNKNKVNAYIKSFIKDTILTEHKKMRDTKSI